LFFDFGKDLVTEKGGFEKNRGAIVFSTKIFLFCKKALYKGFLV